MSEDHTAEREAFEAWYSAEDQETDDPERTYELTEEGMNELTKYCVWQGWQARAAAPAQPECTACGTPVPDDCPTCMLPEPAQPAQPALSAAPAEQQMVAYLDIGAGGYIDLGSELTDEALLRLPKGRHALVIAGTFGIDGYVAAKPSPMPQADSVLEDAARYRWIRGPVEESTRYSRWRIEYWDGPNGWQPMQREIMDSAIDTARKQGGA